MSQLLNFLTDFFYKNKTKNNNINNSILEKLETNNLPHFNELNELEHFNDNDSQNKNLNKDENNTIFKQNFNDNDSQTKNFNNVDEYYSKNLNKDENNTILKENIIDKFYLASETNLDNYNFTFDNIQKIKIDKFFENIETNFQKVSQFIRVFGQKIPDSFSENIIKDNIKIINFRLDLINEEICELFSAIEKNNIIDTIDALIDILYVVYGMGYTLRIDLDKAFNFINYIPKNIVEIDNINSNFKKVKYFIDNYCEKNNTQLSLNSINENIESINFRLNIIKDLYNKLELSCYNNDIVMTIKNLSEILYEIYSMGYSLGIDMDIAFDIVHLSNMSKLCSNEKEALETIEFYKTVPGFENIKIDYRLSSDNKSYVIYNCETSKVLKSKYYIPANFKKMIN